MSTTYGFTNKYLTKDEKPWFPVMGEIHLAVIVQIYGKNLFKK